MARIVPLVIAVAVWIYGIIHCALTKGDLMPGRVPKWGWMLLNIFVPVIGAIIWFVALYMARPDEAEGPASPVAPDDDPEFLARLERENRFREWERRQESAMNGDILEADIIEDFEQDFGDSDSPR